MKEAVLSISGLSKHYGPIKAVDDLSLEINRGEVFGLLGPNGSGKTTTLGIILDVIRPHKGSFHWFGQTPVKDARKRIGSILEVPVFYPYLSAVRNLRIIADIKGLPYDGIDDTLDATGLLDRKNSRFRTYSLGMKQRLAIAAAMLGDPEVMILDEPTNGLDPKGIVEIRELVLKVASRGTTIILASHILDEVQKMCSHVAILDAGRKLFSGRVDEVLNDSEWVELSAYKMDALKLVLQQIPDISSIQEEDDKYLVRLKDNFAPADLNKLLFEKGIVLSHLGTRKKSLEKYFLELLEKS